MPIRGFLDPVTLGRVRTALRGLADVDLVADASELILITTRAGSDVVMVDTSLLTEAETFRLAGSSTFAGRVVVYSAVSTAGIANAVILARHTCAHVIFQGVGDERSLLARALVLAPNLPLGERVLMRLEPRIAFLPAPLVFSLRAMYLGVDGPSTANKLAAYCGMTRRSLDRCIVRNGLSSTRMLVGAPRFIRAYRALLADHIPLTKVAALLRYGSTRTLDQQAQELTGCTATGLRRAKRNDDWVAMEIGNRLIASELSG